MPESLPALAESLPALAVIISITIVVIEWIALTITRRIARPRESWINVACGAASFVPIVALSLTFTLAAMFWLYELRLFELGFAWWVWLLAFVVHDFASFGVHLISHRVRLLWCLHAVHHSAEEMNATVAFRGSLGDLFVLPHAVLWLPLLGFHPLIVVIAEGVVLLWALLLHLSDSYMPKTEPRWLQRILITPSAHRRHHGRNPEYIDTNYGFVFAAWDQLFGTQKGPVAGVEPDYGVTDGVDPTRFGDAQTHAFKLLWRDVKAAPRLRDKLGFVFQRPGWRPNP